MMNPEYNVPPTMAIPPVGARVRLDNPDKDVRGTVVGHAFYASSTATLPPSHLSPGLIVRLDDGGYLDGDRDRMYVSLIVVHPDNAEWINR